jgi:hypothetical protein
MNPQLPAEARLGRAEVAQVRTRDLAGGLKTRVAPITDSLAADIRLGVAGYTPYLPARGWLFRAWRSGARWPR